jgi:hypothetical protein
LRFTTPAPQNRACKGAAGVTGGIVLSAPVKKESKMTKNLNTKSLPMKKGCNMLQISGIWADVMRMGLQGDNDKPDNQWWIEHQKEIEFAFGVLAGLGLAHESGTAEDGTVVWTPSRTMKRLHRYSRFYYGYREARDKHLQANLAMEKACLDD